MRHDDNFDIKGVKECLAAARPIYQLLGHPNNLQAVYPHSIHDFPDNDQQQAYKSVDRALKSNAAVS